MEVMEARTLTKTKEEKSGKPTASIKKKPFLWKSTQGSWGEICDSDPQEFQWVAVLSQSLMWNWTVVAASIDHLERMALTWPAYDAQVLLHTAVYKWTV